jgi:hypothetical protein
MLDYLLFFSYFSVRDILPEPVPLPGADRWQDLRKDSCPACPAT